MSKLIFISNNSAEIAKVREFAKKSGYSLDYYSHAVWKTKNQRQTATTGRKGKNTNRATNNPGLSIVKLPSTKTHSMQTMSEIKVEAIKNALLMGRGSPVKAAHILQIGRATLYRKIKDLNINLNTIRDQLNEKQSRVTLKKSA